MIQERSEMGHIFANVLPNDSSPEMSPYAKKALIAKLF